MLPASENERSALHLIRGWQAACASDSAGHAGEGAALPRAAQTRIRPAPHCPRWPGSGSRQGARAQGGARGHLRLCRAAAVAHSGAGGAEACGRGRAASRSRHKGPVLQRQKWHRCPRCAGLGPSLSATGAGEILRGFFFGFLCKPILSSKTGPEVRAEINPPGPGKRLEPPPSEYFNALRSPWLSCSLVWSWPGLRAQLPAAAGERLRGMEAGKGRACRGRSGPGEPRLPQEGLGGRPRGQQSSTGRGCGPGRGGTRLWCPPRALLLSPGFQGWALRG